jgi:hypothetical protein
MNLSLAWDSSMNAYSSLRLSLRPRCSSPPTAYAGGPPFSCSSGSCIFTFTSMVSLSGSIPRPNSNSRRIPDRSLGRLLTFDGRVRLATTVYVAFRHFKILTSLHTFSVLWAASFSSSGSRVACSNSGQPWSLQASASSDSLILASGLRLCKGHNRLARGTS